MSDEKYSDLKATDLPITLYLNQRLTFDLLVTLQGGLLEFFYGSNDIIRRRNNGCARKSTTWS